MDSTPLNANLWEKIKKELRDKYVDKTKGKRWNAYLSGLLVQEYKRQGGGFDESIPKNSTSLRRWFNEEWKDVGGKAYPVYRPTKKITKDTPLTVAEINKKDLKKKIDEKQLIQGFKNLEPFKAKYPLMPLSEVLKYENAAAKLGVSEVARSSRGFLSAYKKYGIELPIEWQQKREGFIARHLIQYNQKPTERRRLALIMWGFMPQASESPSP